MFFAFYVILIVVTYLTLPGWICFIIIIGIYIWHILHSKYKSLLYPFIIYPFMFIIRASDPNGILLPILPDIIVIGAIVIYIHQSFLYKPTITRDRFPFFVLLILHIMLSASILYYHVFKIDYIPVLIRTYFLPLIFILVLIHASVKDYMIPQVAIRLFSISIAIVAIIALLQYFNILKIPSNIGYLQPTAMASSNITVDGYEGLHDYQAPRATLFAPEVYRINLLTGGSIGTSGAVFVVVSILCFTRIIFNINPLILYAMGLICISAGVLTVSTSIIVPVAVYFILLALSKLKQSILGICSILFVAMLIIYVVADVKLIIDISPYEYFRSTIGQSLIDLIEIVDINYLILGNGPAIFTSNYYFMPDNYIIDIGFLRVFQETGIINFLLFIGFIFGVFIIAIKNVWNISNRSGLIYAFPFITLSLMVHANYSIAPPFHVLFAASVAGILSYKNDRNILINE